MNKGLHISSFSFTDLFCVGALLFKEYPSTLVYADKNKIPHIVEWVDLDKETNANRYFIYKTSYDDLKKYIDHSISHFELILNATGGAVVFFDGSIEDASNFNILSIENIQSDYLPSPKSYFNYEDSEDIGEIIQYFNLSNYQVSEKIITTITKDKIVEYHAEKQKTELFRLHLNTGKYVAHGRAQTDILGGTLISFEGLYHEIANDHLKGKDRTKKITTKQDKIDYAATANTEVVLNEAASFSIYIRPKSTQTQINNNSEINGSIIAAGEQIFHDVIDVINNTISSDLIEKVKNKYNHTVFVKLHEFAEHVKKYDLNVNLDYYSPISNNRWEDRIDIINADKIITTLDNTLVFEDDKFDIIGKFTAINCKTRYCTFNSNEDEEYSGYIDDLLKETIPTFNFVDLYTLTIERKLIKKIADADYKPTDKIMAVLIKK